MSECKCCCNCNCGNGGTTTPDPNESIGGSIVLTPIPLSNGLATPTFGTLKQTNKFYTVCRLLAAGEIPVPDDFITVSTEDEEFVYYDKLMTLDILSYPEPTPVFPEGMQVQEMVEGRWRIFPTNSPNFYIDMFLIQVSENEEGFTSRATFQLVGYETGDSQPFDIPLTLVAGATTSIVHLVLPNPYTIPSTGDVWLTPMNNNEQSIDLASNQSWHFDI